MSLPTQTNITSSSKLETAESRQLELSPLSVENKNILVMSSNTNRYFDIGSINFNIDIDIKKSHEKLPVTFPEDSQGFSMPTTIFKKKLANGECVDRDWLVWSKERAALLCLPCKIFSHENTRKVNLTSCVISIGKQDNLSTKKKNL